MLILFSLIVNETFNSKTIEKIVSKVIIFIVFVAVCINALEVFLFILEDKIFFVLFFFSVVVYLEVS